MSQSGISFEFDGITDDRKRSNVRIFGPFGSPIDKTQVSISDSVLLKNRGLGLDSRAADLIDLGTAIFHVDRWTAATENLDFSRKIHVRLPVRNVDLFNAPENGALLKDILWWFTEDDWTFEFVQYEQIPRLTERQLPLWTESNRDARTEVALWSGGLDAMAGLCNRIDQDSARQFLLVSAGANMPMRGVQKRVLSCLKRRLEADLHLMQLHIYQNVTRHHGLEPNDNLRARAIVFMLLGAAYAYLEGQDKLALYENGPGALNLPFRASEVGLDHARSVHPISLYEISRFVTRILCKPFEIHNPFIDWTKAEMCKVLKKSDISDIAFTTWSCDRSRGSMFWQCGRCSSCLLRRHAFVAAGTNDLTKYRVHHVGRTKREKSLVSSQLLHMVYQAGDLRGILQNDNAWELLSIKYPTQIGEITYRIPDYRIESGRSLPEVIVSMLSRYADEWLDSQTVEYFQEEVWETRLAQRFI